MSTEVRFDVDSAKVGDEIRIPAWWKNGDPTLCRIHAVSPLLSSTGQKVVYVAPLEGNPHLRCVIVHPPEQEARVIELELD